MQIRASGVKCIQHTSVGISQKELGGQTLRHLKQLQLASISHCC